MGQRLKGRTQLEWDKDITVVGQRQSGNGTKTQLNTTGLVHTGTVNKRRGHSGPNPNHQCPVLLSAGL